MLKFLTTIPNIKVGAIALGILVLGNVVPAIDLEKVPAIQYYNQTKASISQFSSDLHQGKQSLKHELRASIVNYVQPAINIADSSSNTSIQYVSSAPIIKNTYSVITQNLSDSQVQQLKTELKQEFKVNQDATYNLDKETLLNILVSLRADLSALQNIRPASVLPQYYANTNNLQPQSAIDSDDLRSKTLTVTEGTTLASLTATTGTFSGSITAAGTTLNGTSYSWPSADGSANQFLRTNGSGTLAWATAGVASNSLDFDEFTNSMTLDANVSIASAGFAFTITDATTTIGGATFHTNGNVGVGTSGPTARLEVNGDVPLLFNVASASGSKFVVRENGGVGVGESDPVTTFGSQFVVRKDQAATTVAEITNQTNNSAAHAQLKLSVATNGAGNPQIAMYALSSINWRIGLDNADDDQLKFSYNSNDAFSTGTTAMTIKTDGSVGIGTTNPQYRLHLNNGKFAINHDGDASYIDFQRASVVKARIYSDNDGTNGGNLIFYTKADSGGALTQRMQINKEGNITFANYGAGACCSDIAEFYPSSEPVEAADVVAVDPNGPVGTLRKARVTDTLVGIVSTNPAIAIEDKHLLVAGGADDYVVNPIKPVIALAGRVPVKVTEENGPIVPGDRVTVSATVMGHAMKMTGSGQSLGIALEASDSAIDKVLVYVNLGYQDIGRELSLNIESIAGLASKSTPESETFTNYFFENLFARITTWLANAGNGITDLFAKKATLEQVCLKDEDGTSCYTRTQLDALISGASLTSTAEPVLALPTEEPTPESTPEPTPEPSVTPEPIPENTPEITPEPTP